MRIKNYRTLAIGVALLTAYWFRFDLVPKLNNLWFNLSSTGTFLNMVLLGFLIVGWILTIRGSWKIVRRI